MKLKKQILIYSVVFVFFASITYLTPLAGDDWGYAINGMKANPFVMAYNFYFTWSGRFFSELWGFIVAPNKWLWNILNPIFFTSIYVLMNKIANKKETWINYLISFALMLYVSDNMRMETYTWIMGTTYVIPLVLSCLYFYIILKYLNTDRRMKKSVIGFLCILNFYITLCMENIAAVILLANIIFLIVQIYHKKEYKAQIYILSVSLLGFIVLRMSPGAAYRLSENTTWTQMSLIQQLISNIPSFLRYSFYDNKYLILSLSTVMLFKTFIDKKRNKYECIFLGILVVVSSLLLVSNKLNSLFPNDLFLFLAQYDTLSSSMYLSLGIWMIYIVYLFYHVFNHYPFDRRMLLLFFIVMAGASNLVMFISPIFGSRSSIYFYFFTLISVMLMIEEIDYKPMYRNILTCAILILIMSRGIAILNKYKMVMHVQEKRLELIQYYLDHPEDKNVYLPRMPIYTVHSADIEVDDVYHMEVFKKYYGLEEDAIIQFYVEDK